MKLPKLYARSSNGKITTFEMEVSENRFRSITGFTDGKATISAWTECTGKSYNTSEEQALKEAQAIWKKKREAGAFENIKDIDEELFFSPMLAKKWEDRMDKVTFPIFSNPKLDGIRVLAKEDGLWSRTGKKILAIPHIYEALKPLFKQYPGIVFDGEAYCDKLNNDFNEICSLVKKTKPTEQDMEESAKVIEYHIYDVIQPDKALNYAFRLDFLNGLKLPKCCIKVKATILKSLKDVDSQLEKYLEEGYEGQILRLDGPYESKRSSNLLKHKRFTTEEFEILKVNEGIGKMTNKAATVTIKTDEGVLVEATINGTHEYLEDLWRRRGEVIGKLGTIRYFNKTQDGSFRFPKLLEIDRWSSE